MIRMLAVDAGAGRVRVSGVRIIFVSTSMLPREVAQYYRAAEKEEEEKRMIVCYPGSLTSSGVCLGDLPPYHCTSMLRAIAAEALSPHCTHARVVRIQSKAQGKYPSGHRRRDLKQAMLYPNDSAIATAHTFLVPSLSYTYSTGAYIPGSHKNHSILQCLSREAGDSSPVIGEISGKCPVSVD